MAKEKIVEVEMDGKKVRVKVGMISWRKAQALIGQSVKFTEKGREVDLEKLRVLIVQNAIKEIDGYDGSVEKFLDEIDWEQGNKIFEVALELNPLEQIMAV